MDVHKQNLPHLFRYHLLYPSFFLDFLFDKGYVKQHQAKELPIYKKLDKTSIFFFLIEQFLPENL